MSAHTPGPWSKEGFEQFVGRGNFYGGLIMGADGETIVAQCVMPHNADLATTAPELLEALRWAASALQVIANGSKPAHELDLIHRTDQHESKTVGQILDSADSAIAKATGSQS